MEARPQQMLAAISVLTSLLMVAVAPSSQIAPVQAVVMWCCGVACLVATEALLRSAEHAAEPRLTSVTLVPIRILEVGVAGALCIEPVAALVNVLHS